MSSIFTEFTDNKEKLYMFLSACSICCIFCLLFLTLMVHFLTLKTSNAVCDETIKKRK